MISKTSKSNRVIIFLVLTIFVFCCMIANPNILKAQTAGQIIGKVTEAGTGSPLPGANIIIEGTNRGAATDMNGRFVIAKVPPGTYNVKVSFLGYQDSSKEVRVNANQTVSVNFALTETVVKGEEVVVYGKLSRGKAKSLHLQKMAPNIKNVVSEEEFSIFPDNNAAEAVRRIPSVTTTTDQGEGSYVQIRGMAPQQCSVTINGIKVPAPSALAVDRKVGLDLVQANLFQSITVTKALTPDMDGDALGGSVNFELKGAPEESYYEVELGGGFNQQHSEFNKYGKDREKFYGTAAKRFLNNKLGVLLSGTYHRINLGSILREWHYNDDALGKEASVIWNKWTDYDPRRTRYGGILTTDYEFNPNNKLILTYSHNTYLDQEIRRKTEFDGKKGRENMEVRNRLEDQRLDMLSLGGKHLLGAVNLDYTLYGVKTHERLPGRTYWRYRRSNSHLKDLSSEEMFNLTGYGNDPWPDAGPLYLRYMKYQTHDTKDNDYGAAFNIKFPYKFLDQNSTFKAGVKVTSKKRTYARTETKSSGGMTDELSTPARVYPFEDVVWDDPEVAKLGFDYKDNSAYDSENFTANEKIIAGYAMTTLNWTNRLSTLVGVRLERTANDYLYTGTYDATNTEPKTNYMNYLPSMHITYKLTSNSNLRLALTTGLARPSYSKLVPYEFVDENDLTVSKGNPDLKPTTAKGVDLFFEKYSSNLGFFGTGFFYKKLEDQIGAHTVFEQRDGETYKVTEPINTEFGKIWGFEIAVNQQLSFLGVKFLQYFGVYANYTYTKATSKFGDRELSFSENPPHIGNLGLTYDNPKIGLVLAIIGNYRGKVIKSVGDDEYTDIWYNREIRLDVSASQRIFGNLTWFVKLNNLTDQEQREILGDPAKDFSHVYQTEYYGPYAESGFRYRF
ncbi:MAG: TonB-dependent receptor [Calditrichaeota bacterium]|nr:TonB-dependent receptor [Calditrichota bacterium]